ncbi:MAG: D-alanine--D-alanine ligase [Clostridia bacterium]|nr:D-alanine--D-alanine ligase [Clostridia bacterium]
MKIVVLAGGLSPERDVSLSSGSLIANALMESGHEVLLLDVYEGIKAGEGDYAGLFKNLAQGKKYRYEIPESEPDLDAIRRRNNGQTSLIGANVLGLCGFADVVFIALHGAMGENGQLQATLDNFGIRYTGTGYIGSLLAMDKDLTKRLLRQAGIPTADWAVYDLHQNISRVAEEIGFPCVVKPCSCGSSVGVSMADTMEELEAAVGCAEKYEAKILIEKKIAGREFSVGVLDGAALPVIEIIPLTGFYDYKNKYQSGLTKEVCPAALTREQTKEVQRRALDVHETLRLGGYSRVDFILDGAGEFICLEANTLPGMTPASLIPQEAQQLGLSYPELCNKIVLLPFEK